MMTGERRPDFLRRDQDFPLLVVSQDYELFFQKSGTIQKCLFEPTDLLLDFADELGMKVTFFVDAGMLCRIATLASESPELGRSLADIRAHVHSIASRRHGIGLHVYPHLEEKRRANES